MTKKETAIDSRINKKLKRINDLFADMPENKKTLFADLMTNAAFIAVALEDLRAEVYEGGIVETYKHGPNQYGTKQSAAMQTYNTLIKNYKVVIETLAKEVPEAVGRSKLDEYLELVNNE